MDDHTDERRRLRIEPSNLANARRLRSQDVPAEKKLWQRLRNRQLNGLKFRRQVPIGGYVADFVCAEVKLVVELDGPSHACRVEHDWERTKYIEARGYRVVRFLNMDVHENIDAVLCSILRECGRGC